MTLTLPVSCQTLTRTHNMMIRQKWRQHHISAIYSIFIYFRYNVFSLHYKGVKSLFSCHFNEIFKRYIFFLQQLEDFKIYLVKLMLYKIRLLKFGFPSFPPL